MKKILVAMVLLAGACNSSPEAKGARQTTQNPESAKINVKDLQIRQQMHRLMYTREGVWEPVRTRDGTALMARDQYGARLLILRKIAGYDVFQLDAACSRKGGYSLSRGLGATRDDLSPTMKSASPGYLDLSKEIRRVCRQKMPVARKMSLDSAVTGLRTLMEQDARPAKLEADDPVRKQAMEAMARYRAAKKAK